MTVVKDLTDVISDSNVSELANVTVVNTAWEGDKDCEVVWITFNKESNRLEIIIQEN